MVVLLVLSIVMFWIVLGIILRITGGYAPGWRVRCRTCDHKRDAAKVGIVRVGKSVRAKRTFGWCANCRRLRAFMVERKPESDQQGSSR